MKTKEKMLNNLRSIRTLLRRYQAFENDDVAIAIGKIDEVMGFFNDESESTKKGKIL